MAHEQVPQQIPQPKAPQPPAHPFPHLSQQPQPSQPSMGPSTIKPAPSPSPTVPPSHVSQSGSSAVHQHSSSKHGIEGSAGPGFHVSTPMSQQQRPGPQGMGSSRQGPGGGMGAGGDTVNKKQLKETDALEYLNQVVFCVCDALE